MLAEDLTENRLVAIKIIRVKSNAFYSMKKLLREITLHKKLTSMENGSLHFVELYDVLIDNTESDSIQAFLVMEYIDHSLHQFFKSGKLQ